MTQLQELDLVIGHTNGTRTVHGWTDRLGGWNNYLEGLELAVLSLNVSAWNSDFRQHFDKRTTNLRFYHLLRFKIRPRTARKFKWQSGNSNQRCSNSNTNKWKKQSNLTQLYVTRLKRMCPFADFQYKVAFLGG